MLAFKPGKILKTKIKFDPENRAVLPVFVYAPKNATDTTRRVFVSAGIHGNEINGLFCLRLIKRKLDINKLNCILYLLPIVNSPAYLRGNRGAGVDSKDLNRNFMRFRKDSKTTFINYLANAIITEIVKPCDFGIDLHDSGDRDIFALHARAHIGKSGICQRGCTLNLAKASGLEFILKRIGFRGSLSLSAWRYLQKRVLTIEIGGGRRFWPEYIKLAQEAVFNILMAEGVYQGRPKLPDKQYIIKKNKLHWLTSLQDGILSLKVSPGQKVVRDEAVGEIYDPISGVSFFVKSDRCGFIFGVRRKTLIKAGQGIVCILSPQRCWPHKGEKFDQKVEIIFNN